MKPKCVKTKIDNQSMPLTDQGARLQLLDFLGENIENLSFEYSGIAGNTSEIIHGFRAMIKNEDWLNFILDAGDPESKPVPKPEMRSVLRPIGPVFIYAEEGCVPLSFTISLQVLPALLAGCPVVLAVNGILCEDIKKIIKGIEHAMQKVGYSAKLFSTVEQADSKVLTEIFSHLSFHALVIDTQELEHKKILHSIFDGLLSPCPIFEREQHGNITLLLPEFDQGKQSGLISGYLDFSRVCKEAGILRPNILLLPQELETRGFENWRATLSQEFFHFDLKTLSNFCGELELNIGEKSSGIQVFFYNSLKECSEFFNRLENVRPVQIFGSCIDQKDMDGLIKEIEFQSNLLSLHCFPTAKDLSIAAFTTTPTCTNLKSKQDLGARLLLSRFLRPVCFQEVPDAYLPS